MKKGNKFLVLTGVGVQMMVTIFLGAYFGRILDEKYPAEKKWFTMGLTIFAVFVSLYLVVQQLKSLNKDDE
ncbi:MAG: hypothetical protein COA32_02485 [Fluviicola sp.]|nr:MAG: hypothetical protein COA32_02485 [Fluviicola sp.]